MQISQNNNPSFGINSVKFTNSLVKSEFEEMTKKISPKKLTKMWEEIKNIKPNKGPDVDVFINGSLLSYGRLGLQHPTVNLEVRKGKNTSIVEHVLEGKPKKIIEGFKNLITKVDKMENCGKSTNPDLIVF